jgi:putative sterol carrier protein
MTIGGYHPGGNSRNMAKFPTPEWLDAIMVKLNSDQRYAQIAHNWEGDMVFQIDPSGALKQPMRYYMDLWHGKCRGVKEVPDGSQMKPAFVLKGPYDNYVRLLKGELDPMQALLTRKIGLTGNMAILMRSVPTVLDFVRCCREITDSFI